MSSCLSAECGAVVKGGMKPEAWSLSYKLITFALTKKEPGIRKQWLTKPKNNRVRITSILSALPGERGILTLVNRAGHSRKEVSSRILYEQFQNLRNLKMEAVSQFF